MSGWRRSIPSPGHRRSGAICATSPHGGHSGARTATWPSTSPTISSGGTADGTSRADNADLIRSIIEAWLADKSRAQAVEALEQQGVPSGPVYTAADVFDDAHIAARRMLVTVDDPVAGPRRYARTPLHLSSAPEIPTAPAPQLGEHTRTVLRNLLGYEEAEIDRLRDKGVIEIF
jgi:CoA:oxalate CoA-transferase